MPPQPEAVSAWWAALWPLSSFILGAAVIIHEVFFRRQAQLQVLGLGAIGCGWAIDRFTRWLGESTTKKP